MAKVRNKNENNFNIISNIDKNISVGMQNQIPYQPIRGYDKSPQDSSQSYQNHVQMQPTNLDQNTFKNPIQMPQEQSNNNNNNYDQIENPEQGKNQTQEPPKQNEVKEKQSSQKPDQELIMSEEEYINKMSDYMATQHEQNPNVNPWYDHTREEYDAYVNYMLTNNPHVIFIFLFATA